MRKRAKVHLKNGVLVAGTVGVMLLVVLFSDIPKYGLVGWGVIVASGVVLYLVAAFALFPNNQTGEVLDECHDNIVTLNGLASSAVDPNVGVILEEIVRWCQKILTKAKKTKDFEYVNALGFKSYLNQLLDMFENAAEVEEADTNKLKRVSRRLKAYFERLNAGKRALLATDLELLEISMGKEDLSEEE